MREVVIGMAHRGRLNVLANIIGKPSTQIFSEFEGKLDPTSTQGSGDVKYHLGASRRTRADASGRDDRASSLASNPSHLEAVDPVVEGIVRAEAGPRWATRSARACCRCSSTATPPSPARASSPRRCNLSQLDGYRTGGTIHLVINNQIGFTTRPEDARSTPYCDRRRAHACRRRSST